MIETTWVFADGNWGLNETHLDWVSQGKAVFPMGNMYYVYARSQNQSRFATYMESTGLTYDHVSFYFAFSFKISLILILQTFQIPFHFTHFYRRMKLSSVPFYSFWTRVGFRIVFNLTLISKSMAETRALFFKEMEGSSS